MKELSIEQKAEAYEKAVKKARACHKNTCLRNTLETLESIFPELKESESEDEKIRKALITFFQNFLFDSIENAGTNANEAIAWLKKQESDYTFEIKEGHWYKCVCDYMLNGSDLMFKNGRLYYCRSDWRLEGEIDERNVKDIGVKGYKSFFRPATNQEIKDWLEKQSEQKHIEWDRKDDQNLYACLDYIQGHQPSRLKTSRLGCPETG